MADSLKTVLGFDAAEAISTLSSMEKQLKSYSTAMRAAASATRKFNKDAAVTDGVIKKQTNTITGFAASQKKSSIATDQHSTAVKNLSTTIKNLNAANRKLKTTSKQLASENAKLKKGVQDVGKTTKKASKDMILSWKSVIRIFTIQIIHQMISKVTSSLKETISAAIDVENRFAEIETIGGPLTGRFEHISKEVRKLSDEFVIQADIVAEGIYETLSNQIAEGEEAFTFFAAAAKFSIAAVTSADSAVNLLSSTINAFGYNASQTEVIAGKLFRTIDLGRIRGEEFADTFGRVAVLASNLGISLDEVLAAIATLTISGLKYNEAFTLITNTILKLIKPTDALKETYEELGIVSAEAAIQAYGLQGFLDKLAKSAGGTATEIGELFSRVRAIRGVIGLTGQAAETFAKNIEAIRAAGSEDLIAAQEIVFKTNAKQLQIEIEEVKNALLFDFGRPAIKVINELFDTFGGAVEILKTFTYVLGAAAVAMTGLAIVTWPYYALIASLTVLILKWELIYRKANQTAIDGIKERIRLEKKAVEEINIREAELAEARIRHMKGQFGYVQRYLIERIKASKNIKDTAIQAEEYISKILNEQLDDRISAVNSFVSTIEDRQLSAIANIAAAQSRIFSLEQEQASAFFNIRINQLKTYEKYEVAKKRAWDLRLQAEKAAREGDKERADSLFTEAKTIAQIAVTSAEELGYVREKGTALGLLTSIYQSQLSVQKRIKEEEAKKARIAKSAYSEEKARADRIQTIIKRLQEIRLFGKDGKMMFPTPEAANAAIKPLLARLRGEFDDLGRDINIFKKLDLEQQFQEIIKPFEDAFTRRPISLDFLYKQRIDEVFKDIKNIAKIQDPLILKIAAHFEFDITTLAGMEEMSKRWPKISEAIEKGMRSVAELEGAQEVLRNAKKNIGGLLKGIQEEMGKTVRSVQVGIMGMGEETITPKYGKKVKDQFTTIAEAVKIAKEQVKDFTDPEKFHSAILILDQMKAAFEETEADKLVEGMKIMIEQLKAGGEAAENIKIKTGQVQSIKDLKEVLKGIPNEFYKSGEAANEGANKIISASSRIKTTLQTEINLIRQRNVELAQPQNKSYGGMIYRQLGGFTPQGTDTVPAMLTPGEFVINADATKKFYSQLVAINSGRKPIFRERGGPVTNVGDVSITVNESISAKTTARETMTAFRREMRRHTSRL